MSKIILLCYQNLIERDYNFLCIQPLLDSSIDVEYWDLSLLFGFPKLIADNKFSPSEKLLIREISSWIEYKQLVENNSKALFLFNMTCSSEQTKLLEATTKYRCKTAIFCDSPTPLVNTSASTLEKYRGRLKGFRRKAIKKFKNEILRIKFRLGILNYYSYCFSAGADGITVIGVTDRQLLKNIILLPINSPDYSKFVFNESDDALIAGDYIVFVDEYLPFHPDIIINSYKTIPADVYFTLLNKTFSKIEENYGMPIVIAAHPKAQLYLEHNYFEGRTVIFNNTINLVRHSKVVLGHDSTSLGYVSLTNTPLTLFYSNWMRDIEGNMFRSILAFSRAFGATMINMDSDDRIDISLTISEEQKALYNEYKYRYMTNSVINESNEVLMVKYVKHILNI